MIRSRLSRLFRITASLLLLCLGGLVAESLIADVCDGDANGVRTAGALTMGATAPDAGGPSDGGDRPDAPAQHSTHVEHCLHPHAGAPIATAPMALLPDQPRGQVAASRVLAPASPTLEPAIRPPAL